MSGGRIMIFVLRASSSSNPYQNLENGNFRVAFDIVTVTLSHLATVGQLNHHQDDDDL